MRINSVMSYGTQSYNKNYVARKNAQQVQPNFRGLKGTLCGGATGAGITALGVSLIAGPAALPLFGGYLLANGLFGAIAGHLVESDVKNKDSDK